MKVLSLRPYFGSIRLCTTRTEYRAQYKRLFREECTVLTPDKLGRMDGKWGQDHPPIFLVWAKDAPRLAHELSHVILEIFRMAGIDPREAQGEPFCYMLSQLMLEAR